MLLRSILLTTVLATTLFCAAQVSEKPSRMINVGKAEVTAVAISPKGDHVLVGTNDGAVYSNIESGKKLYSFPYEEDGGKAVYYAGFNENGEFAVLIGHSGKRTVWSIANGKQEKVMTAHRWVPDPRAVKTMGLDMSNSNFDRFYQQTEVRMGDILVRSGKKGIVEFVDTEGKVQRTITFPENKDQHHQAPLLLWDKYLLVGTDNGSVLFYDVL